MKWEGTTARLSALPRYNHRTFFLLRAVLFRFASFRFVSCCFVSFVSFRFVSFRFVSLFFVFVSVRDGVAVSCSAFLATTVSAESVVLAQARETPLFGTWKWGSDDPQAFFEGEFSCIVSPRGVVLVFCLRCSDAAIPLG